MFRFLENSPLSRAIALTLGRVTLLSARLAALLERDAKKIVALSTLRQLGLIVIVLFLGNKRGIFFHLLTHALAKANLFIVVGAILHETASQQRTRVLSITSYGILSLRIAVSIVRLSGLGFFSGIISKEELLKGHYSIASRLGSFVFISLIVFLTLSYCLKLFLSLSLSKLKTAIKGTISVSNTVAPFSLSILTIFFGALYANNLSVLYIYLGRYRAYTLIGIVALITLNMSLTALQGFILHEV